MTHSNSLYKKLLNISAIIVFSLICSTFSACYTVETAYYEPEELIKSELEEISEIKMKNDSIIHPENLNIRFIKNPDIDKCILIFEKSDSTYSKDNYPDRTKLISEIKFRDIQFAKVRTKELDVEKTTLLMKGGIAVAILLGLLFLGNTFTVVGSPF